MDIFEGIRFMLATTRVVVGAVLIGVVLLLMGWGGAVWVLAAAAALGVIAAASLFTAALCAMPLKEALGLWVGMVPLGAMLWGWSTKQWWLLALGAVVLAPALLLALRPVLHWCVPWLKKSD